jgi:hypothetical protein
MSNLEFSYEAKDNASPTIDKITNRLQGLRGEYREMKKSLGDIKQSLNTMSGMGIGLASGALNASGLGKDASTPKDARIKTTQAPFVEGINSVAQMGALMVGGAIGGKLIDSFNRDGNGIVSTIGNRIASNASLSAKSSFSAFAQNMINWEGGGTKSWGRLMRNGSRASVSGMGGGFAGGASSVGSAGALLRGGGIMARLGAGLATGGVALAAQLGYEYGVQPMIDETAKVWEKKEYTKEYLAGLGTNYLNSNRRKQRQDTWNDAVGGLNGQMYLLGEIFGTNKSKVEGLERGLSEERSTRTAEITKALWLQNRE